MFFLFQSFTGHKTPLHVFLTLKKESISGFIWCTHSSITKALITPSLHPALVSAEPCTHLLQILCLTPLAMTVSGSSLRTLLHRHIPRLACFLPISKCQPFLFFIPFCVANHSILSAKYTRTYHLSIIFFLSTRQNKRSKNLEI